jgi:uncharacterized protein (DUF1501 family)
VNRRAWLRTCGAALAVLAGRSLLPRARAAAAPVGSRPRFYLQLIPDGGMDAVYTIDPKSRADVEPDIDAPFKAHEIVDAQGIRLAPTFKALAPWAPRLAVVNAFRQNSANHISGLIHTTRCKSRASLATPALFDILGARRGDEAVGVVNLGTTFDSAFSPKFLGEPSFFGFGASPGLFEHLDDAKPDELIDVSHALAREAKALAGRTSATSAASGVSADNLREAAALFARVATAPRFAPTEWKLGSIQDREPRYLGARDLQRVLWLFENRLARCVTLSLGVQAYDTHIWNTVIQPPMTEYLAALLDRLFAELDRRIVDGRPLSEQVVVMLGSEIGRFPRLNVARGKDHFPQVPYLFFGRWFAAGRFGETDRQLVAQPVSLATGRPERAGHVLRVDDIGTTLLTLDGADPSVFGYSGEHLAFLTG